MFTQQVPLSWPGSTLIRISRATARSSATCELVRECRRWNPLSGARPAGTASDRRTPAPLHCLIYIDSSMLSGMRQGRADDPDGHAAAADALYGLMAAAVRQQPREISLTSASTLATVERTGPRRITDLAVIEGVSQPSMTALVTILERSGLVERRSDPADQRVVLVALTTAGAEYLRSRRRAGADSFARLIDKLPPAEAAALLAATPALRHLHQLDNEQRTAVRQEPAGLKTPPATQPIGQHDAP